MAKQRRILVLALWSVGCATTSRPDLDLFTAVKADDATEAERLVAAGAKVNAKNDGYFEGLPALGWAAVWGSRKTAEVLIARGADVNARAAHGDTPLHVAAYNQQPAVAEVLLRHGADANAQSASGFDTTVAFGQPSRRAKDSMGWSAAQP